MKYSDALKRVSPHLARYPAGLNALRVLARWERECEGEDGWGTAEAVYWLSYFWHGGQWCPLYAAGCATEYTPGHLETGPGDVGEMILSEVLDALHLEVN